MTYHGDNHIPQVLELDQLHTGKDSELIATDVHGTGHGQILAGPLEVPVEVVRVRHPPIDRTPESLLLIGPQFAAVGRTGTGSVAWEELFPILDEAVCGEETSKVLLVEGDGW